MKKMRIYDIGANVGKFTESNIKKYEDCEFILVEANPSLIEILNNKFKDKINVIILNKCVSDTDNSKIDFYLSDSDTISTASNFWVNESRFKNYNYKSIISCETISINTLIKIYGKSDYIKIDVEGYEHTVIKNINNYIGLLSFEWAEEMKEDMIKILYHLRNIDYKNFYMSHGDDYTFIPEEFYDFETIISKVESLDIDRKQKWGMIFAK